MAAIAGESGRTDATNLARLAREIARPERDWVILAEGNVSSRVGGNRMLVKASGVRMRDAAADDMVPLELDEVLTVIDDAARSEEDVIALFDATQRAHGARPSVEALLHAVCLDVPGIAVVGHAHPTPVLAVLSSVRPEAVLDGLFPDQIVVLGAHPLFVPYADPGLVLAREVRRMLRRTKASPRLLFLQNHGIFALGATEDDVLQILEMSVKVARVLIGAETMGGVHRLSDADVRRIDTRQDEIYRRAVLARGR